MQNLRIGLALTGSYCTYDKAIAAAEKLAEKYEVTAIMSETAYATDSRFGDAEDFVTKLEAITGREANTPEMPRLTHIFRVRVTMTMESMEPSHPMLMAN